MSNTTPKRTPAMSTASSGRRPPPAASTASSTPGVRGASPAAVLSSNGTAGTPSSTSKSTPTGRPARPNVRRPVGGSNASADDEAKAEEARAELENMRASLKEAEAASEDYQRQLAAAQQKIDELSAEQTRLEEEYHETSERVQELEFEQREAKRHAQEMERIYDQERAAMGRDREDSSSREAELKASIQRLKETIAEREFRSSAGPEGQADSKLKPGDRDETAQFAPSLPRNDSQSSRNLVQKDQIVEGLRLELAEAQIKVIELENAAAGGDRAQELEKQLLETRMANARLQEDNESFQLLLGERTISGDFQKTELMQGGRASVSTPSGLGSLAEELDAAEGEVGNSRRLEAELKSFKDQNKALTLYIEKIISRVLQHDNFETILDQKGGLGAVPGRSHPSTDKDLPPPPPAKDDKSQGDGFLQRATSVVRRQRPVSTMFTPAAPPAEDSPTLTVRQTRPRSSNGPAVLDRLPTANENPATAPSIPLGRASSVSHRGGRASIHARPGSQSGPVPPNTASSTTGSVLSAPTSPERNEIPGAAGIVSQMYRGPPSAGSPGAPPLSPLASPGGTRGAYFGGALKTSSGAGSPGQPRPSSESAASGTSAGGGLGGDSGSVSGVSTSGAASGAPSVGGGAPSVGDGPGPASPPRDRAGNTQYTGAVMQQNRLRPLRLAQEYGGDEAARKKANRGSWMGWFNRKEEGGAGGGPGGVPGLDRMEE